MDITLTRQDIFAKQFTRVPALVSLFSRYIKPGDLVFDIGASVGVYTQAFHELGAQVVAVEPMLGINPDLCESLFLMRDNVTCLSCAVSSRSGLATILFNRDSNYCFPSIDREWIASSSYAHCYPQDSAEGITTTVTLDQLIAYFGTPALIKIDVEGHGLDVIEGLSQPIQTIAFEFHKSWFHDAIKTIARLDQLGFYEYNYSLAENDRLAFSSNHASIGLVHKLKHLDDKAWGDIFARYIGER